MVQEQKKAREDLYNDLYDLITKNRKLGINDNEIYEIFEGISYLTFIKPIDRINAKQEN